MSIDTKCKHPLKAFQDGFNADTGKPHYVVTPFDVKYIVKGVGKIGYRYSEPDERIKSRTDLFVTDFIEIPCGHCISCRLRYSKDWANRMLLEAQEHDSNWFLTLTYNDKYLPKPFNCINPDTGETEVSPVHPLVKRDIQLFMKRLRKKFPDQKIRFYACGEYGSQNMRPHYHLILFGLKLPDDDLQFLKKNELGDNYYVSSIIDSLWSNVDTKESLGFHILASVTWETCAYTARYVTKKLSGEESEIYERYNFPREWSLCSRKPGIARNYYEQHKDDIYKNQEIFLNLGEKGGKRIRPPKYYDRLFDIDAPDEMYIIKEDRKEIAEINNRLKSSLSSLSYEQQNAVDELNLNARTKILKRSL